MLAYNVACPVCGEDAAHVLPAHSTRDAVGVRINGEFENICVWSGDEVPKVYYHGKVQGDMMLVRKE
jgi:hypothetical protein